MGTHNGLLDFAALKAAHELAMADFEANHDAYEARVEKACQDTVRLGAHESDVANVRRQWERGLLTLADVDDLLDDLLAL